MSWQSPYVRVNPLGHLSETGTLTLVCLDTLGEDWSPRHVHLDTLDGAWNLGRVGGPGTLRLHVPEPTGEDHGLGPTGAISRLRPNGEVCKIFLRLFF